MGKPSSWMRYDGEQNEDGTRTPEARHLTDAQAKTGVGLGSTLAVGAAFILYGITAPLSVPATVAVAGVGLVGAGVAGYSVNDKANEARESVEGADQRQKGTVEGLIRKGQAKSGESRDAFFDKLQEMFPEESKHIGEARKATPAPEEKTESDGKSAASEEGPSTEGAGSGGAGESGSPTSESASSGSSDGDGGSEGSKAPKGEGVSSGSDGLTSDNRN